MSYEEAVGVLSSITTSRRKFTPEERFALEIAMEALVGYQGMTKAHDLLSTHDWFTVKASNRPPAPDLNIWTLSNGGSNLVATLGTGDLLMVGRKKK